MSSAFPASLHLGAVIDGRFSLLRWLGGTKRTSVFFTEIDADPARPAAIKLISAECVDADARLSQWSAAQALSHPNLVRLLHFGRCVIQGTDCLYVVTEYAEELLSEILPERALTPAETRELLTPVLAALAHLHSRKLVHGALKPSNIMVVEDRIKLSVDEICRAGEPDTRASSSAEYDAPEVASSVLSPAADIWSLGMVLVAARTTQTPAWHRASGVDPAVPPTLHVPFLAIAQQCLRLDPARRGTLNDVKAALAPPLEPKAVQSAPASAAFKMRLVVLAAAVLVAAVVFAVVKFASRSTPPSGMPPQTASAAPLPKPSPIQRQTVLPAAVASPASSAPSPVASAATNASPIDASSAHGPLPDVPQAARATIRGQFRSSIRVQVDPGGNVSSADIHSQGPSRYFANLALQAARNWKFKPEAGAWALEFQFRQDGTTVTPTPLAR